MKTLLTLLLMTNISYAKALSVVPDRVVTPPLDLYSRLNKTLPDGSFRVRVTKVSKRGDFIQNGDLKILSSEQYNSYKNSADAVFEMIPKQTNTNNEEKKYRKGTVFHIGENLVLTNQHVLDPSRQNASICDDFQVMNHSGDAFDCKRVHFCDTINDVCLIEMEPKIKKKRSCFFCSGDNYEVSLSQGPSLKLKSTYNPGLETQGEEIITAIGNSAGFGIHYSQGRGVVIQKNILYFYAPITSGNSGGAILNEEGKVIGLVKQQSKIVISDDPTEAYNVAVPTNLVISIMRNALRDNPETLLKFNNSVVE